MERSGGRSSAPLRSPDRSCCEGLERRDGQSPPADFLVHVINGLQRGVVLLSSSGQVTFANPAAQALLERRHPVTVDQDRLRVVSPGQQARLDRFLASTQCSSDAMVLRLNTASGGALTLLVNRLDPGVDLPTGFLVFLFDHDSATPTNPELLREFYELTPAEANVAGLLYNGRSLKVIAAELDCSINTVRAHLKHVFRKCGVHSQAELVRLLALGPYWG
ncbi:MAG: helix-turn-helix transcriptional regulator [Gammaproteobacteria bacterium]|nr:MAG: helix-turn-helix transcriptional regulator [Gammaproteobacteria bacterium]